MQRTGTVPLVVLTLLSLATSMAMGQVIGGPIINPANGHEYYLLERDTWTNSQAAAVALGGNLVTVNDAAEQQWLVNTFGPINSDFSENRFYIGLNDQLVEGNFVWASGEPVMYTNWFPGEPNDAGSDGGEDFVSIGRYANGQWNDERGNSAFGVVEVIPAPGAVSLLMAMGLCSITRLRRVG